MSTDLVFFLHRLGIKVYRVKIDGTVTELADIPSLDIGEIVKKLESFSGSTVRLLTSDSISYLFQSHINTTNTPLSREIILQKIKTEIPEDVESMRWDYKIVSQTADSAEVVIFAPVVDFQKLISNVSRQLRLVVEAIEPESIATTRHPNPIVGITRKNDIGEKDETSLNISEGEPSSNQVKTFLIIKPILLVLGIVIFVFSNYLLYQRYRLSQGQAPSVSPSPTVAPTLAITPTSTPSPPKKFSDISLIVQNGTPRSGYAGSISAKFKENGVTNVTSANAPRDDYATSELTFASDELKNLHLSKFTAIFPISATSVKVDKTQSVDAILILGIN